MEDPVALLPKANPPYPKGTVGEIGFCFELKFDGHLNRIEGIRPNKLARLSKETVTRGSLIPAVSSSRKLSFDCGDSKHACKIIGPSLGRELRPSPWDLSNKRFETCLRSNGRKRSGPTASSSTPSHTPEPTERGACQHSWHAMFVRRREPRKWG